MVGRALLVFNGAIGDTVAAVPACVELARRHGSLEVRGSAERLLLLDAAPGDLAGGSIEGTGWHRLHAPDAPAEALAIEVAGRAVHVPEDPVVVANLRRLGAEVHPYRPLPSPGERVHFSDRYWRELTGLALPAPAPSLVLPPSWPRPRGGLFGILHPGSGSISKNRSARELAELVRLLPGPVVLLEGPADGGAVEALRSLVDLEVRRGLSIPELVALLAAARYFVGHDSGPTHVAAALGVPAVGLYTSTDPARWGPRGPRVLVVGPGRSAEAAVVAIREFLEENQQNAGRSPRSHPL